MHRLRWASALVLALTAGQASAATPVTSWAAWVQMVTLAGNYQGKLVCNGTTPCDPYNSQTNQTGYSHSATDTRAQGFLSSTGRYLQPNDLNSDAYALADLATGSLHVSEHVSLPQNLNFSGGTTPVSSFSQAILWETIHLHVAPGTPQFVPVTAKLHVDGSFLRSSTRFLFSMGGFGPGLVAEVFWSSADGAGTTADLANFSVGRQSAGWTSFGPEDFVGTTMFDTDYDVSFVMALESSSYKNSYSEFGHTAALSLVLPQGVTFTSDSGVFLTEPLAAVPEPNSWALLVTGFGLVGVAVRKRERAVAA